MELHIKYKTDAQTINHEHVGSGKTSCVHVKLRSVGITLAAKFVYRLEVAFGCLSSTNCIVKWLL